MLSTQHVLATAETLLQYREEEFLCDTVLVAKDRQLKAHSILLAAVSPVFRSAFCSGAFPGRMFQVDLPDVDSSILETALDFIYTGNLVLPSVHYASTDNLSTLFSTLQDLGLDLEKLNGCEMKFRSDLEHKDARPSDDVESGIAGEKIIRDQLEVEGAATIKHETTDDLDMEASLPTSVLNLNETNASPAKKVSKEISWSETVGDNVGKVNIVAGHLNLNIDDSEKAVVVSEDLLNDLVGGQHNFDDVEEDGDEEDGDHDGNENDVRMIDDIDQKMDSGETCILVEMENGSESRYVVVMPHSESAARQLVTMLVGTPTSVRRADRSAHQPAASTRIR
jgi:hypothetical protein